MKNYLQLSSLIQTSNQTDARALALSYNVPLVAHYLSRCEVGDTFSVGMLADQLGWNILCAKKAQRMKVKVNQQVSGHASHYEQSELESALSEVRKATREQIKQALIHVFTDSILEHYSLTRSAIYLGYGKFYADRHGVETVFRTPVGIWAPQAKKDGVRQEVVNRFRSEVKNPPVCVKVKHGRKWLKDYAAAFSRDRVLSNKQFDQLLYAPGALCASFANL